MSEIWRRSSKISGPIVKVYLSNYIIAYSNITLIDHGSNSTRMKSTAKGNIMEAPAANFLWSLQILLPVHKESFEVFS